MNRRTRRPGESDAVRLARITNDFLHDLATGTWFGAIIILIVMSQRLGDLPPLAADALTDSARVVVWLAITALLVIGVTGGLRLRYWRKDTAPDDVATKRRALWVKHAVFAVVYGVGTVWAWSVVY
jgi:putative copper export protein